MTQPNRRRNGLVLIAIAISLLFCLRLSPPPLLATNLFQSPPTSPLGLGSLSIPIKVFLRGPYNTSRGLMNDSLRVLNLLPTTEPYNALTRFGHIGGEQVNAGVFAVTGRNAIVDWVLVELRSAGDATRILATRAALVQRDGDVVDMDGISPVIFANQNPGSYYVVVGHRNHLRVMTANPVTVNTNSPLVDFTSPTAATYGNYGQVLVGLVQMLWSGDANNNNQVVYSGPSNDQNAVLTRVLTDPGNTTGSTNYVVNGYGVTDLNLDGKTIAAGPSNEMNVILTTVLSYPGNSNQNGNYVVQEQALAGVWTPPRAASIPLPASASDAAAYIVQDLDFASVMSAAAKVARLQRGEPIPATAKVAPGSTTTAQVSKPGLLAPVPLPRLQTSQVGWTSIYTETFDGNFPGPGANGKCTLEIKSRISGNLSKNYEWGLSDFRKDGSSGGSAWPAAGGTRRPSLRPGYETYPENLQSDYICRFTNLNNARLKNIMVEFTLWLDTGDSGDKLFVGFNTGETESSSGNEIFYGREWQQTPFDASGNHAWQRYRFFYPELPAKINANGGKLAVVWRFTSDGTRHANLFGAWLDSINVEKYVQPEPTASVKDKWGNCEGLDEKTEVPGAVGPGSSNLVSKGIVMDIGTEDGVNDRMGRLRSIGTDWVRLEMKINAVARIRDYSDATIDLKHFDELIDSLCANEIAVLGVLDYETLYSQSWKRFKPDDSPSDEGGVVNENGYLEAFVNITKVLVKYYDDRIGAWEVWNEPDYLPTRLRENQYVILLKAVYDVIKGPNGVDRDDKVVWGGLGGVNEDAFTYFRNAYASVVINYPGASPFNIFALHPYYFTDHTGKLMLRPSDYLHYDWSADQLRTDGYTPIEAFRTELAQQDRNKEIWVTEIGWNSAKDSLKAGNCPSLQPQHVTQSEQASYLFNSFDILFKQTGWNATTPAITKIFWYQYRDTGVEKTRKECGLDGTAQSTRVQSPSWGASLMARYQSPEIRKDANPADTPWQYGLFGGDWASKPAANSFGTYPPTYNFYVYLPSVRNRQTTVNARNSEPDVTNESDEIYTDNIVLEPAHTPLEHDTSINFYIYLPTAISE